MKSFKLIVFLGIVFFRWIPAQPPPGYYAPATGLFRDSLKQALHQIINNHTPVAYNTLFTHFQTTDIKQDGSVWDMYSDLPGGTPPYVYYYVPQDQCGNYTQEGDCFNREHSFPKSWFGGDIMPMYSDLFHLYPTDGFVNGQRGNLPYGIVQTSNWVSQNGSKRGISGLPGVGIVFEPIDAYKGDLARTMFYMAVRYYGQDASWPGSEMTYGAMLKPWALSILRVWHQQDPVSQKELDRNNAVYAIQNNRNPFIDNPQFVEDIWSPWAGMPELVNPILHLAPNPACNHLTVFFNEKTEAGMQLQIISLLGSTLQTEWISPGADQLALDVSGLPKGCYLIRVMAEGRPPTMGGKVMINCSGM